MGEREPDGFIEAEGGSKNHGVTSVETSGGGPHDGRVVGRKEERRGQSEHVLQGGEPTLGPTVLRAEEHMGATLPRHFTLA